MKKHGWRAIIYDAPWAIFEPNQTGIIISEDGKSCETADDSISSVKIIIDPESESSGGDGHILFRQKGSDLFDIVCING